MIPASPKGRIHRQRAICNNRALYVDDSEFVRNILSVWDCRNDAAMSAMSWYEDSAQLVQDVSGLGRLSACGIAAALSPQSAWSQNVLDVESLVLSGRTLALPLSELRAKRILDGESPWSVLGGRKVRSFFANLYDPTHPGPVNVDRHAVSIVYGRPLYGTESKMLERPGVYQLVTAAFRSAARELDILPNQLQAVTWTQWRNTHAKGWADRDILEGVF